MLYSYIGNILVTIAGIYNGNGNLNQFINAGRLCGVGRFYNIGIFGCNGGRGG